MEEQPKQRGSLELFPQLPREIRLEIWRFSIPWEPRLLPCKPIAGLAVNSESRNVYLETYELCFVPHEISEAIYPYRISHYANFEIDTFFIDMDIARGQFFWDIEDPVQPLGRYLVTSAFAKLRNVAIADQAWYFMNRPLPEWSSARYTKIRFLQLFTNLSMFMVVLEDQAHNLEASKRHMARGRPISYMDDQRREEYLAGFKDLYEERMSDGRKLLEASIEHQNEAENNWGPVRSDLDDFMWLTKKDKPEWQKPEIEVMTLGFLDSDHAGHHDWQAGGEMTQVQQSNEEEDLGFAWFASISDSNR